MAVMVVSERWAAVRTPIDRFVPNMSSRGPIDRRATDGLGVRCS
jgi:hypothetical protein